MAVVAALVAALGAAVLGGCRGGWPDPAAARAEDRLPVLSTELDGVTIPPNLAPPYFRVREPGTEYAVEFVASGGGGFRGRCPQGACRWDAAAWRALLAVNRDADVGIQVSVRQVQTIL